MDKKYVYYILHIPRYTGKVEHYGIIYPNIFPPIISDELWQKVSSINDENKFAPSRKKEIFNYILSVKLVCGECRHKMSGKCDTSRNGDRYYYYVCLSQRRRKIDCKTKAVLKKWLEDT